MKKKKRIKRVSNGFKGLYGSRNLGKKIEKKLGFWGITEIRAWVFFFFFKFLGEIEKLKKESCSALFSLKT